MGYIEHEEPKDPKKIIEYINETCANYRQKFKIVNLILEGLKEFEGKKITKRIANKLQEVPELKKYAIYLYPIGGMTYICVQGADIKFEDRIQFLIAYDSDYYIRMDKVTEYNNPYLNNEKTAQKLERGKSVVEMFCAVWNKHLKELQKLNKNAEYYHLEYQFEMGGK